MTYLATLYSQSLDRFETDCETDIWGSDDIAFWVRRLPGYYNKIHGVDDFQIISIVKIGE